jgi:hypothetical protein
VFAIDADNPQEGVRGLPSNVIQFSVFYDNPIGPPPQLQSPLGNPTLTLPVTLNWAHVPNPQSSGYVWMVATDPGFNNIEAFNNRYTGPTAVMLSLTSGPKYWRVLSQHGLSSPTTNAVTAWSTTGQFTISSAPARPVSIAPMGNTQMVMYSGGSGVVAVQLTAGVPPAGATIQLSSSHPAVAPVPASISMQGGHAWTSFPFTVGQATTPTVVTLSATLNGVTASRRQGVVTAAEGAGHDEIMQVESSEPALAAVPDTVTVFAGSGVGFFDITTAAVSAPTAVTISVTGGGTTLSKILTLYPTLPPLTSMTVSPSSVAGGASATGTVRLGGPAPPNGVAINLASNQRLSASVPLSVTVPGGATSATFTVTTFPGVTNTPQLSAAMNGTFVFAAITVNDGPPPPPPSASLSAVSVSPSSVTGGSSSTGTVTLSGAAPSGGAVVSLSENSTATSVPASVTVAAGSSSATFTITTTSVTTATSSTLSAAYNSVTRTAALTVNPPAQPPPPTPAAPSLVSPADAATGVAQPATLD